jgi:hypothetical protein
MPPPPLASAKISPLFVRRQLKPANTAANPSPSLFGVI